MVQNSHSWMEASDVIPIFPSFVWKVRLEPGLRAVIRPPAVELIAENTDDDSSKGDS